MTDHDNVVDRAYYEAMSTDQLVARLKVAEDALLWVGWSPTRDDTPRAKAATQAWMNWANMIGDRSFTDPTRHPDLDDKREADLAAQRDRTRTETLRRYFGEEAV